MHKRRKIMKKRTLSLILALLMVFSLLPVSAAADAPKSGTCGKNLTWTLTDDGVLTVSGTGAMYDFDGGTPWDSYKASIKSVVVNSGVTHIGKRAFLAASALENVSLPDSVTSIGNYAFGACRSLESISIPAGVTVVSDGMLSNCEKLKRVRIPGSVTKIGNFALQGCYGLESIVLPAGVTSIGGQAFMACSGLKSIRIPAGVASIGPGAFSMCDNLKDVYFRGTETQWKAIPGLDITGISDSAVMHFMSAYPFTDVKPAGSHKPFADAILWASEEGITTGYGNGIFKPDANCTRAQVVTFLWRAAGEPAPKSTTNPFVDVEAKQANGKDNPYYTAILWAVGEGITLGVDKTHFAPDATVTRAQFVTFLWRYENKPEAKPGVTLKDLDTVTNADFKSAILWAAGEGITTGYDGDGSFRPNAVCTRAHVVTFIYRDMAE